MVPSANIEKGLSVVLIGVFLLSGVAAESFELDFQLYANDTAVVQSIDTSQTPAMEFANFIPGPYRIAVESEGNVLWNKTTQIEFSRPGVNVNNTSTFADARHFSWRLPYNATADRIVLSKQGQELFSIDLVQRFCVQDQLCPELCDGREADPDCIAEQPYICGDGVCERDVGENASTCAIDCSSDASSGNDTTTPSPEPGEETGGLPWVWIGAGIIVVSVLFILLTSIQSE